MTDITPAYQPNGTARYALSASLASLVLLVLYFTPWVGQFVLYGSIVFGVIAVVFGIRGLVRKQPKGLAITGLVIGALTALLGLGIILFALMFVGAFSG